MTSRQIGYQTNEVCRSKIWQLAWSLLVDQPGGLGSSEPSHLAFSSSSPRRLSARYLMSYATAESVKGEVRKRPCRFSAREGEVPPIHDVQEAESKRANGRRGHCPLEEQPNNNLFLETWPDVHWYPSLLIRRSPNM